LAFSQRVGRGTLAAMDESLLPDPPLLPTRAKPSRGRRIVRAIGWVSVIAGVLVLGFVVQQVFVTSWLAERNQVALEEDAREYFGDVEVVEVPLAEVLENAAPSGETTAVTPDDMRTLLVESPPEAHQPFAIIRAPGITALEDGWTVVEGVERADLKNGAGHMSHTPIPGQPGNAVISGHRTTYGAPFHDLDLLEPGDRIEVETGLGIHGYEVRETIIVDPFALWVTEPRQGAWLTLTTCHPKFSSQERMVLFAELVDGPNAESILAS
jgi:sortase A